MSEPSRRILLFIPMYNCARQIPRVLEKVDAAAARHIAFTLVVDNGSGDGSREAAVEALKRRPDLRAMVVRNRENYSLGGSHKVAFNYAVDNGFTHVVVLHGDDQADVRDLTPHLESGAFDRTDSFLGSRFMRGSRRQGYSALRTLLNFAFNLTFSVLAGVWITDQGSGLNLYRVDYLKSRFYLPFDNSLMFPNQMFFHGAARPGGFAYFPITWREEDQVSNARMLSQAWKVLKVVLARRLGREPGDTAFSRMEYAFTEVYRQ